MMQLRVLGLALLVTAALLAFVSTGAASADAFCRDAVNPCFEGYAPPTPFTAVTKSAVLKGAGFEETCSSTLAGESTSYLAKGEGVNGKVTSLVFSSCTGTCTAASATSLPYSLLALATEGGNGTATASSSGEGNPGLKLTGCTGTKETCTYSTAKVPLGFTGGKGGSEANDATLAVNSVTLTKTAGPCPATASLTAKYVANKVGIQTNASWYWWSDDPVITWSDYDFGEITAKTTQTVTFVISNKVELQYGGLSLVGNGENVFAKGVDNCSNQRILGKCTVEVKATPKEAGPTYEATLQVPWEEVGGSGFGTLNIRLRCKGK